MTIETKAAVRSFDAAAADYDDHAVLQREVADRLLERLDDFEDFAPERAVDVGAGTGYVAGALRARFNKTRLIALDPARSMLGRAATRSGWWRPYRCVQGRAEQLPLAARSTQLWASSLAVQWCPDFDAVLREARRVLQPGGRLLLATFGPDTLHELRDSWRAVSQHAHVNDFRDIQSIGDQLMSHGFRDPVLDREMITLTYDDARQLMRELKAIGAHNVNQNRHHGLTGKRRLAGMLEAYEAFRSEGRLPASYEVIYASAVAPEHGQPIKSGQGNIAHFPVDQIPRRRRS